MNQSFSYLMVVLLLLNGMTLLAQETKTYTQQALEAQKLRETGDKSIPVTTDAQYKERLEKIGNQFPMKFNNLVKSHIRAYTERRRSSTETIIGRSAIYFPIFETALMRHHIPTDLKYLSIVESALDPTAVSPAGARGLWQFMKGTGKQYNLRISKYVDERSDPQMSSEAAARFLKDLYARYGDWALSITAYNCGPGRVNSAIKKAGSTDYWKIMKYLPKETRNYVPAFIAVAYTLNYYHLHNIYPIFPEYDIQVTEHVRIFKKASFADIAKKTETDVKTVKFLNPGYKYNFIPASKSGYVLTLPMTKMTAYREWDPTAKTLYFSPPAVEPGDGQAYLVSGKIDNSPISTTATTKVEYKQVKKIYNVRKGDNLGKIATKYGVTVSELRKWNKLKGSLLYIDQKLVVYETERIETPIENLEAPVENRKVAYYVDGKPVYTQEVMADPEKEMPTSMDKETPMATAPQATQTNIEITSHESETISVRTSASVQKKIEAAAKVEEKTEEVITDNRVVAYYLDGEPIYADAIGKEAKKEEVSENTTVAAQPAINVRTAASTAKEDTTIHKVSKEDIQYYDVRRGDTLWKISRKYSVTVNELMKWNKITHHNQLRPGMELKIHKK